MRILSARSVRQASSPQGFRALSKFNLQVTKDVIICDFNTGRSARRSRHSYGSGRDGNTLSVAPELRRKNVEMALAAVGVSNEQRAA